MKKTTKLILEKKIKNNWQISKQFLFYITHFYVFFNLNNSKYKYEFIKN